MPGSLTVNTTFSRNLGSPIEETDPKKGLPEEQLRYIEEIEVIARHILQSRTIGENDPYYDSLERNETELSQRLDDYISLNHLYTEYTNQKKVIKDLKKSLQKKTAALNAYETELSQRKTESTEYAHVRAATYKRLESRYFNRSYRAVITSHLTKNPHTLNEAIAQGDRIDYNISKEMQDQGFIARICSNYSNDKMRVTDAYLQSRKIVWEKMGNSRHPISIRKSHRSPHPALVRYRAFKDQSKVELVKRMSAAVTAQGMLNDARRKLFQIEGDIHKGGVKINDYNLSLSQKKLLEAAEKTETALNFFIPQS